MSPMPWFREYLIAKNPGAVWDAREDFAVRICMQMQAAEKLARHVLDSADAFIRHDNCSPGNAKTLFFALEKTGEYKYRQAIQRVMNCLNEQSASQGALSSLYETLPFRMAYEMKLNRMEGVSRTVADYRGAHMNCWDAAKRLHRLGEGFSLKEEAWFLMALADGISLCSDQLYEHWRALVDIYRETLSGVLCRMTPQGLLRANLTDGQEDASGTAIVLYALLMGVQMGLIDPERYLPVARRGIAALRANGEGYAADMMEAVFGVI